MMRIMIREEIREIIQEAVRRVQQEEKWPGFKIPEIQIEHPENAGFGDYSTNISMILAGLIKKNPMEIAKLLIKYLDLGVLLPIRRRTPKSSPKSKFKKIEIARPGFINFTLSKDYLQKQIKETLKQGDKFGQLKIGKNKKVQVEFISANPTGPLTVGNARGGPFGDVLANVLKMAGFRVEKAYYVNDYGMQILTLGHSVLKDKEAKYKGAYIDELSKRIKEKDPEKAGQKAAKIILKEMIQKTTVRLGIKFDEWFSEQTLYDSGQVEKALITLKKKNLIYEKEGALWFKSSKFGDEKDRVVVKANDFKTYLAGDIAHHLYKFEKKKFDKVINIWGADHYGDMKRLKGAMESFGHKDKLKIIFLQFVSLLEKGEGIKMSKRAGVYVTMDELLDKVGIDAVRFFFLQKSPDTHLNFDLSLAKEQSEKNPVYYVQYAHARICSILRKIPNQKSQIPNKFQIPNSKFKNLTNHFELNLIRQLIRFPEIIEDIIKDYQVQRLPYYALDLAAAFHKFYKDCRVLSEDKLLTQARLALVKATQIVLKNTLEIMGIRAPSKM